MRPAGIAITDVVRGAGASVEHVREAVRPHHETPSAIYVRFALEVHCKVGDEFRLGSIAALFRARESALDARQRAEKIFVRAIIPPSRRESNKHCRFPLSVSAVSGCVPV
jgi:hypothetical protein